MTAFIIAMYAVPQPLEEMLFEFMEGTAVKLMYVTINIIPQPLEEMLFEFMEGTAAIDSTGNLLGSGDVK